MQTPSLKEIKQELQHLSIKEISDLCLQLAKLQKTNKEFLSYLLFESSDEQQFIENVKEEIDTLFLNTASLNYHLKKKSVRKILKETKKYIRYSKKKETEIELLLFFCAQLKSIKSSNAYDEVLYNLFHRQIEKIEKTISSLHEDLQYDYNLLLDEIV